MTSDWVKQQCRVRASVLLGCLMPYHAIPSHPMPSHLMSCHVAGNDQRFWYGSDPAITPLRYAPRCTALACSTCACVLISYMHDRCVHVHVYVLGGIRSSGFGCFNGPEGLRGFSRVQSVVTDRFGIRAQVGRHTQQQRNNMPCHVDVCSGLRHVPVICHPFQTPSFLQYPVARDAHVLVQHAIRLVYSRTWLSSARALWALIRRAPIHVKEKAV